MDFMELMTDVLESTVVVLSGVVLLFCCYDTLETYLAYRREQKLNASFDAHKEDDPYTKL
jgi:hypothetical protein